MPLPRVRIVLNADYRENLVEIDGHNVTNAVAGIRVGKAAGEPFTEVELLIRADVELDADVAEVVIDRGVDEPVLAAEDFLAEVDAGELEVAALARMNGLDGGPTSFGQAYMEVLREW